MCLQCQRLWDEGYQAAYLFERGEVYPEPTNPYTEPDAPCAQRQEPS